MAEDAHTLFIDGQRVTAAHLQHLQDRLREAVGDVRRSIGLDKVAWGLRATLQDGDVSVQPGAAFTASGVRLHLDTQALVTLPETDAPWQVLLRAQNADVEELRHNDAATLVTATTQLVVESVSEVSDPDAVVIATVGTSSEGPVLSQDASRFNTAGTHSHSGEWYQDALGNWYYDGAELAGEPGPPGEPGVPGPQGEIGPPGADGVNGAAGEQGPAGPAGPQGEAGPAGDPGPAGADGTPGEPGPRGEQGEAGPAGEQGPPGQPGEPGAAGPRGEPGAAGPAGEQGPRGAGGEAGAVGEPGARGEQGETGPAGASGPRGERGQAGPAGEQGPQGEVGPRGPRGSKGNPGDPGPVGAEGPAGARGPRGQRGEPGEGLDPDWPAAAEISWKHGVTVTLDGAISMLSELAVAMSAPFGPRTREEQPQAMQVLYERNPSPANAVLGLVLTLPGTFKLSARQGEWRTSLSRDQLGSVLGPGGRVWLRLHCGALLDEQERPMSGSPDVLHGSKTPRAPGGVLESWFIIRGE